MALLTLLRRVFVRRSSRFRSLEPLPNHLGPRPRNGNVDGVMSLGRQTSQVYAGDNGAEPATIALYHRRLMKVVREFSVVVHKVDSEPDEYLSVMQLRKYQAALNQAIEVYYAALGTRDATSIAPAMAISTQIEHRLRSFDDEIHGEITRFELTTDVIISCFQSVPVPSSLVDVCAEANELLLEIGVYRTDRDIAIQSETRVRLDVVQSKLESVLDFVTNSEFALPQASQFDMPNVEGGGRISGTSSDDGTYAAQISQRVPLESKLDPTHLLSPNVRQEREIGNDIQRESSAQHPQFHHRKELGQNWDRINANLPRNRALRGTHIEYVLEVHSEVGEGPSLQSTRIMSRSRTLKDMAASALSDHDEIENFATTAAELMFTEYAQIASQESPTLANEKISAPVCRSFASMLYATHNVGSVPVSDSGKVFQRIVVRGDGRCLFRSIARARSVVQGDRVLSERAERDIADDLRCKTVVELRRHRALLQQFYVIESDFTYYTKKMANPRTFGGEPELLMLAKILHSPIGVYISTAGRFKQIQVYGRQYGGELIRVLYSDGIHYDALIEVRKRN